MRQLSAAMLAAVLLLLLGMPAPASAQAVLDCEYFNFQEQAQAILDEDETDPFFLDEDGDGTACNDLPLADFDAARPPLPEDGDYQCVDFPWQELAQEVYDEDPSDPHNLDPTGDAFPCSRLPFLADYAFEEDPATLDPALDEEGLEEDPLLEDPLAEADPAAETENAAVNTGDPAADAEAGADEPLTEEEREARRAERRAARQAERQAEREAAEGEAPAEEDTGQ
jgi:hypothetical protein